MRSWTKRWGSDRVRVAAVVLMAASLVMTAMPAAAAKQYAAKGTPMRAIQELDEMLDDFKVREGGKPLSEKDEEHNRTLKRKIIHGTFDIRELAQRSLGKHWPQRSGAEQDQFVQILTDLLEEKALFSKEQSAAKSKSGGKYYVVYRGQQYDKSKKRAYVRTKVVVPAENVDIELNYKLVKKGDEWKIYDVIVDEASLVKNYQYQFNSIITKHGYPDLVRRMEKKLGEIRTDRNATGDAKKAGAGDKKKSETGGEKKAGT